MDESVVMLFLVNLLMVMRYLRSVSTYLCVIAIECRNGAAMAMAIVVCCLWGG